jgi:dihydroorotate dehydrogenase (NAD+) catalytic subunit
LALALNSNAKVRESQVELAGIELAHPVLNGSGTFDAIAALRAFGEPLRERFPFAAFVSKTITLAARGGNPPPRLWETPAGMINSIGLPNKGLAGFLERDLPVLATLPVPLIVSVAGFGHEEFARLVSDVAARPEVAALELNISCPNVEKGGMLFGNSPAATASLVSRVRTATRSTLVVKLSPNAPDLVESARAARDSGADVLSLVNTFVGMAIDPATARPRLSFGTGGLSGPAIKPLALRMVFQVARALPGVPLMGIGGISDLSDVLEFLAAGASAVQIGTANFRDPGVSGRLVNELTAYCADRRATVSELVGRAQRTGTGGEAGAEG